MILNIILHNNLYIARTCVQVRPILFGDFRIRRLFPLGFCAHLPLDILFLKQARKYPLRNVQNNIFIYRSSLFLDDLFHLV